MIHAPAPDGRGVTVLRARNERLEAGVLRPLEDGKPITGEIVKLTPRDEPMLYDVETQMTVPEPAAPTDVARATSGPAQVATDGYRKGWDAIWQRSTPSRAN